MKLLFVCKYNAGRSQMAQALFNKFSKKHTSNSAGIKALERMNYPLPEFVVRDMNERGIDMSKYHRKQLTQEMAERADKVILFVPRRAWPEYLKNSPKAVYWKIADAKGKSYDFHCKIRDKIENLVTSLVKEIG